MALALEGLGRVLQEFERWQQAQEVLERSLAIRIAVFGPMHPDVAGAHKELGALASRRGRHDAAREAFTRALEIHEANHSTSDLRVLTARVDRLMAAAGLEPVEAELTAWTERLEETRAALGDEHPLMIRIHDALGSSYARAGYTEHATKHWRASIRVSRARLGETHPTVAEAELKLGRLLRDAGEMEAAEAVLRRALDTFVAHHGPNHARTLEARNELASSFDRAGDPRRARALDETTARAVADDEPARAQVAIARARLDLASR